MSTDLIGQMLGPYQIIEFVGMEGAAEVYKGYHSEQNIPVLVRLVGRGLPADSVWNSRFRREAKVVAALKHANIAPILDFGEALDGHYMVSELIEGSTLADVIAEAKAGLRTLQPDDITFIVRQIAAGLDEAHGKGAVHRDLCPRRVLITRSGQAIVTDFGLPTLLSRGAEEAAGGAAFGAPEYMAPEALIDFRAATPASDIYSLGAILFEVVTGELPFGEWSEANGVARAISRDGPDPRLLSKNVPPTVSHTIMTALAETPSERFINALQFAEQLEWAYHNPLADPLKRRKAGRAEAPPAVEPPAASAPDKVVVKRGPSLTDERREKARLRAEHRKLQNEEKKRIAVEQREIAAQRRREQAAVARAFYARWGRTFVALILFTAILIGILYGLTALGFLTVNFTAPNVQFIIVNPFGFGATPTPPAVTETEPATEIAVLPVTAPPTVEGNATQETIPPTPSPTLPPVALTPLGVGSGAFRLVDGGAMVHVPAGQFLMGTNDILFSPAVRPQHPVTLSAYWIDTTEVTNIQYASCVEAGACQPPANAVYYSTPQYAKFPVTFVAYDQAASYCLWLAAQTGQVIGLPTEAQWEKAAVWDPVTESQRLFPWGETWPNGELARYVYSSDGRPASPVGAHPKGVSAYGALDMAGNVWEWTADWFDPAYYQSAETAQDPIGPLSGTDRVTRGGSWRVDADLLVPIKRNPARPDVNGDSLGFRCAMSTERPPVESGIALTPLDAAQGLAEKISAASAEGFDPTLTDEWMAALGNIREALLAGDNGAALALTETLLDSLDQQESAGQLPDNLAWLLERGLNWIKDRLALEVEATVETPTPESSPTPAQTSAPSP